MSLLRKILFSIVITSVLILALWIAILWYRFTRIPMSEAAKTKQSTITIKVPSGTGIRYLAHLLLKHSLIKNKGIFILCTRFMENTPLLKTGEYQITKTTTLRKLLNDIVTGNTKQRSITFIEGWTFHQVRKTLKENSYIRHTINKLSDQKIMEKLGDNRYPEGLFFPDTYFFTWRDTDLQILHRAYDRMQMILKKIWKNREKGLPYKNSYQALIVASLIEKEATLPKEHAKISGVILRRLKKSMLLQIDPTVLYGLGLPYNNPITKKDLTFYTPYNTYRNHGLPPTPIDMPSYRSIWAALNPDLRSADLYYVARGDGGHEFSVTYQSHLTAVRKYQRNA
ncbi:endolytic transglycosylase MltG [Coxiella endosymbiont of Amblyomma americanum]|uniref:endolytic transglycosylase MltG n=1 Tax=Coxiella endosymbiont of Amblyomma americanum TaxID=325775 RepID=UPI00057F6ABD|nr:endolytic transglycosylase MltG [Coxiella endosymbiont of Amblyomma americanum]AJC50660.1 hypothetical protein Z664_02975 [Coxiella endosymbiont of Amblyomma americanum]